MSPIECDALVIGAGPVGLFQVFELGLLEIGSQVVDSLPHVGGQCVALYADKPIYDIPALPVCTGRELVDRLMTQIAPMRAGFHLDQVVTAVMRRDDERFDVETSTGTLFNSRTIFIAGGVGAFRPRALKVPGVDKHLGRQLFYRVDDPASLDGRHVLIVGGEDEAVDLAVDLPRVASVTLVHRREEFKAAPDTLARLAALRESGYVRFIAGQIIGIHEDGGRLVAVDVVGPDDATVRVELDALIVRQGLSPKLGPIAEWGLTLERRQVAVDTATFETNVPGIFAVGDIVTYPGKRKLILSGFHEATLAAFAAAPYVHPDRPVRLQYTTTSPTLHRLLGVVSNRDDSGDRS